jgi:hypothetical protein
VAKAGKYGEVPFENIPDDEPVFVIRAKDRAALETLYAYVEYVEDVGAEKEFIDHITEQVVPDFRAWQQSHDTKVPD